MRDFIDRWTHGEHWRTWIAHAAIALLLTAAFGWWLGWWVAVGYYLIRELEQLLYDYVDRRPASPWWDHLMDVAAPAVVVAVFLIGRG